MPFGDVQTQVRGVGTTRSSELRGREVISAGGERRGTVSDLLVNEKTGAFDAVEVAWGHRLAGLRSRHSLVPASREFRIGRHAVIVPDAVLHDHEGDADGSHEDCTHGRFERLVFRPAGRRGNQGAGIHEMMRPVPAGPPP